jgi:hypothetical protein
VYAQVFVRVGFGFCALLGTGAGGADAIFRTVRLVKVRRANTDLLVEAH